MNFNKSRLQLLHTVLRREFSTSPFSKARQTNHYEELGVGRGASRKEIQAKFYELSKIYHPDAPSTSTSGSLESRTSKFQAISQSYSILSDDSARKTYDQTIHGSYGRRPGYTSGAGHEAGSRSGFGGGNSYSSGENSARRERANYAWSHPRRSSTMNQTYSGSTAEAQGRAEPVRNRPGNGPTTASEDLFSRFAAREVRSRARAAANAGNRPSQNGQHHFGTTASGTEAFGEKAEEESRLINESGVKRSGTVLLLFGGTFAVAVLFSEGKRETR